MRLGKLSSEELERLVLSKTSVKNAEIIQSAGLAEDCSAIKSDKILLLTTDPITATGAHSGELAILVSANDIAVSGGVPLCCLLTVIAPADGTVDEISRFMTTASKKAAELGIDIVGGHTEFSDAVNKMVVVCTMLGTTKKVIKTGGAKAGDSIIMTKSAAIEATAIMAHDYRERLLAAGLTEKELAEAEGYINDISVIKEAAVAAKLPETHSMHDVTEGGVYGAVAELAETSNLGATVYADSIPVTKLTLKICKALKVSPKRLIGSGSMLIVTSSPEKTLTALKKAGVTGTIIGTLRTKKEITAIGEGVSEKLKVQPDELLLINKNL